MLKPQGYAEIKMSEMANALELKALGFLFKTIFLYETFPYIFHFNLDKIWQIGKVTQYLEIGYTSTLITFILAKHGNKSDTTF